MFTFDTSEDRMTVALSRAERWIVHHALVDRLDSFLAVDQIPPWWVPRLIDRFERDTIELTRLEADHLRRFLVSHQDHIDVPPGELELAEGVVRRLELLFDPM